MRYSNPAAEALFSIITRFARDASIRSELETAISQCTVETLRSCNSHGDTLLHDTLCLATDPSALLSVAQLLFAHCDTLNSPETKRLFLTHTNDSGFTLLYHILKSNLPAVVLQAFFAWLTDTADNQIITAGNVHALLLKTTNVRSTAMHAALGSSNPETGSLYLQAMKAAFQTNILSPAKYRMLLVNVNREGTSPLHTGLNTGNPITVQMYLIMVNEAFENKIITAEDVRQLLIRATEHGFTPLHEVLIGAESENVSIYLKMVNDALTSRILSREDVRNLLVSVNSGGYTPLHQVLKSGKFNNVAAYLEMVNQAVAQNILPATDVRSLLMGTTRTGFNPMHEVLKSSSREAVRLFFQMLNDATTSGILVPDDIRQLLTEKSGVGGLVAMHQAFLSCSFENVRLYFDLVRDAQTAKILTRHEVRQLLIDRPNSGTSAFRCAINSENLEIVRCYVHRLQDCFNNEEIAFQLNIRTKDNALLSAKPGTPQCDEINQYLATKREEYKRPSSSRTVTATNSTAVSVSAAATTSTEFVRSFGSRSSPVSGRRKVSVDFSLLGRTEKKRKLENSEESTSSMPTPR